MTEYIEREATASAIRTMQQPRRPKTNVGLAFAVDIVNMMPAADVAPVRRGTWTHLGGDEWCCNVCGHVISTEGSWENPLLDHGIRFCENCGARMDGGAE